ncbi:DUF2621 domain-containing protein [Sporosarcina thermotolerans]|uniref:DUF2621 domain-containing protein n=1 Tax=Sporosarcina thermotolerans TaxID=633404 RepID=A0AAW9A432_9BACL|nr:DUF2621 domain-containing protein [Sporosarcina thermotolerans]MDW0115494.1 DUF2621 domain-containing protein [Sporosarcina thermotolerans]WHT49929.1 DUF2621 domain-containing protein [Sporosarcina thermotolerans]
MWFIVFWCFVLIGLFGIGGFFMFRKFLKVFPKADGKSTLDWEEHYVNESLHLWNDEAKAMLNELVSPVPELFRDVAKQKIGAKIGQIALEDRAKTISFDHIIRGYIVATPKRDHKFLRKKLDSMKVDMSPYEHLFE